MRLADVLDAINAQASVRVTERDLRLALNELVSEGKWWLLRAWAMVTVGEGAALWRCGRRVKVLCAACRPASLLTSPPHKPFPPNPAHRRRTLRGCSRAW